MREIFFFSLIINQDRQILIGPVPLPKAPITCKASFHLEESSLCDSDRSYFSFILHFGNPRSIKTITSTVYISIARFLQNLLRIYLFSYSKKIEGFETTENASIELDPGGSKN